MSTTISTNEVYQFIKTKLGSDGQLDVKEAKELGIKGDFLKEADDQDSMDIDDVIADDRLYEDFANMAKAEKDEEAKAKDKEEEDKEGDERRTGNKGGSGGA